MYIKLLTVKCQQLFVLNVGEHPCVLPIFFVILYTITLKHLYKTTDKISVGHINIP